MFECVSFRKRRNHLSAENDKIVRVISAGPMVNGEGKRHHSPVRGAGPTIDKCWWMAQGRTPQEEEEMRCLHVSIAAGHLVAHKTAFWIRNVTFVPIYLQQWSAGGSRWLWPARLKSRGKRLNLRPVLLPPPYTSPRASWIGDNVSYWRVKVCRGESNCGGPQRRWRCTFLLFSYLCRAKKKL